MVGVCCAFMSIETMHILDPVKMSPRTQNWHSNPGEWNLLPGQITPFLGHLIFHFFLLVKRGYACPSLKCLFSVKNCDNVESEFKSVQFYQGEGSETFFGRNSEWKTSLLWKAKSDAFVMRARAKNLCNNWKRIASHHGRRGSSRIVCHSSLKVWNTNKFVNEPTECQGGFLTKLPWHSQREKESKHTKAKYSNWTQPD